MKFLNGDDSPTNPRLITASRYLTRAYHPILSTTVVNISRINKGETKMSNRDLFLQKPAGTRMIFGNGQSIEFETILLDRFKVEVTRNTYIGDDQNAEPCISKDRYYYEDGEDAFNKYNSLCSDSRVYESELKRCLIYRTHSGSCNSIRIAEIEYGAEIKLETGDL